MPYDLAQMQSLPLRAKIIMTHQRARQWYEYWDGQVYVSLSGGKDSTVLADLCAQVCRDYGWTLYLLFVNTGLEYPEIQKFVKTYAEWLRQTYSIEVVLDIVRPEMRFDEVIKKYGYPVVSKAVSQHIKAGRTALKKGNQNSFALQMFRGEYKDANGDKSLFNQEQWAFLLDAPYDISNQCCDVMKKRPIKKYEKISRRKPIIGTMASESRHRYTQWVKFGCNAFDKNKPSSQPISFWTEQDILHYLKQFNVPYCSVYGDIVVDEKVDGENILEGQINLIDYLGCHEESDRLTTTGCSRTGCIFCMFGCHLEKEPNRFQRLKETHPRQYEYCINGGEYVWEATYKNRAIGKIQKVSWVNDDGTPMTKEQIEKFVEKRNIEGSIFTFKKVWQPSKEGLGLGKVLDYIGVKY